MSKNTKVKFRKDDPEQIALGVEVMVNAYKSKCKYRIKAVENALKKMDARDVAKLPRANSLVVTLGVLEIAMKEKKCPEGQDRGWQIVVKQAYGQLTNGQMSVNDIKEEIPPEKPSEDVTVPDVCEQERVMEDDADGARRDDERRRSIVLGSAYPRMFAFLQDNGCEDLHTETGVTYEKIPIETLALLFLDQYERRFANV